MTNAQNYDPDALDGPALSAVSWGAVIAGAVVAMAISLIVLALAAGFSAGTLALWPNLGRGLVKITAATAIWLIIAQWLSAGVGGYITGRLRTRWRNLHTHEVFFRDTANGLIAWALATVAVAMLGAVMAGSAPDAAAMAATQASPDQIAAASKAAAAFSIFTGLSMLVGAFVACVAAALGGQQRDLHP